MKPAAFAYHAPRTLDETLTVLGDLGDDARVLAGGQSLVPMMNLRLARPAHLVDVNGVAELDFIRAAGDKIEIGALARHHEVATSALVAERCPVLAAAAGTIGHYAIRQRGTLGGSLALADPAAQLPLLAVLLGAEIEAQSKRGPRTLKASEFFVSVYTTALRADEIVVRAVFPSLRPGAGWGLRSLCRRAGDFAVVAAATVVAIDKRGRVGEVRAALGGVESVPLSLDETARVYVGEAADGAWRTALAEAAARRVEPRGDLHASAEWRRELVAVLLDRALADAVGRAQRT